MNKTRHEMKAQYQALAKTYDRVMAEAGALRALSEAYAPRALVFIGLRLGLLPVPVGRAERVLPRGAAGLRLRRGGSDAARRAV